MKKTSVVVEFQTVSLASVMSEVRQGQPLIGCQGDHVTHLFLSCDPRAECGQQHYTSACPYPETIRVMTSRKSAVSHLPTRSLMPMFACGDNTFIHYTLVCDFRTDCQGKSDESFCKHPLCVNSFRCNSGQCVSYRKRGDLVSDCIDHSDELFVDAQTEHTFKVIRMNPPMVIDFTEQGRVTKRKMQHNETCPDTHYRCPGPYTYCLPVYTRCNGYYDCSGQEDELHCETFKCPGLYRCLNSSVCVHPDHLCDNNPQCPERDDEWLCEEKPCPEGCFCHGLSFFCNKLFDAHLFPQLRLLNGTGSGISLGNLTSNLYLMHLVLANCQLENLPVVELQNLLYLDLSHNMLKTFNVYSLSRLVNLKTLVMAHNPLSHVHSEETPWSVTALRTINMSHCQLQSFSSKPFAAFLGLRRLDLSFTSIKEIRSDGFSHISTLRELYLTESTVEKYPFDMFHSLERLQKVEAGNYKLCCKLILPSHLEQHLCTAPRNEISSCDDLLRSGGYNFFLWLVCFLSLTGNVFCLAFRSLVQRKSAKSAFNMFVSSLTIADLLMGVYLAMIGSADELFRGKYVLNERVWVNSVTCRTAGFLSLLSSEVSALTILLITLDRFIVLNFPFSQVRFKKTSAGVACLTTWVVGLVLATLPLLPVTSHWEFYSQTGICIPLPVTRQDFKGRTYSVGIMIVFNFVLFLFIAAGQAIIYRSVQKNTITTDTTKSHDTTVARRLITVAVSDFLCWFPISLCGLLALAGTSINGEVNVALAILVLPLNSALNPFLYTMNVVLEKRRKVYEEKLMNELKLTIDSANENNQVN